MWVWTVAKGNTIRRLFHLSFSSQTSKWLIVCAKHLVTVISASIFIIVIILFCFYSDNCNVNWTTEAGFQ